ncbi:MAG: DUF6034 family protein [Ruminococcus sp.]|jgi:hypothetical protein
MKRIRHILIFVIMSMIFCGCQQTPDERIVTNKTDNKLEEKIMSSEEKSKPLKADENWEEEFDSADGRVKIKIDALITIPEEEKFPVVSCTPHYFKLDEIQNVIRVLFGETELYDDSVSDKEWLEAEIIRNQNNLAYLKKNGVYPEGEDAVVKDLEEEILWLEDYIMQLEEDYQAATQNTIPLKNIVLNENDSGGESVMIRDGQTPAMQFYAVNSPDINDAAMEYSVKGSDFTEGEPITETDQAEIGISRENAKQKAIETVKSCGLPECEIMSEEWTNISGIKSYVFEVSRQISGIPCNYISEYEGTLSYGGDGKEYREPWKQENIRVIVNETGVVGFLWEYPPEIQSTINENVSILSYEEIKEIAKKQLQRSQTVNEYEMTFAGEKQIEINKIVLGMMRVVKKDSADEYYYLPVWDFIGKTKVRGSNEENTDKDTSAKSYLTLNAIDGSVIDRGLGY